MIAMKHRNEILSARWRNLSIPRRLTEDFRPFETIEGMVDWRGLTISSCDTLEIDAASVDLSKAVFEGATISLKLRESLVDNVTITDCGLTAAKIDSCHVQRLAFRDSSASYSRFVNCNVTDLTFESSAADSVTFDGGVIERLFILKGSAEKLRFVSCEVFLLLNTFMQGNLTFSGCEGLAVFAPRSIPHRLFNRSASMIYGVAPGIATLVRDARTSGWTFRDALSTPGANLSLLDLEPDSVVMLRDTMARLKRTVVRKKY